MQCEICGAELHIGDQVAVVTYKSGQQGLLCWIDASTTPTQPLTSDLLTQQVELSDEVCVVCGKPLSVGEVKNTRPGRAFTCNQHWGQSQEQAKQLWRKIISEEKGGK